VVQDRDARYLNIIISPIRICANYKPKMGRGGKSGLSLTAFQEMYRRDPFYSWFGLDNPLMYAAHKAAGGMTSVYRQIGIGCENLFRTILQDELGLTEEQSKWSYSITGANRRTRTLSLDGRIPLDAIDNSEKKERIVNWIREIARTLDVEPQVIGSLQGAVFEVRQGYKSKDSKRQNADIANAATAYTRAYLPCVVLMSSQIDDDIRIRYRREKWGILTGHIGGSSIDSTYTFFHEVIGYDLAAFFDRHADKLRQEVARVLETLLKAE